jgi:hypothetical protein
VSVEAIAFVKSLDLGGCEKARLLMYVIGENTFNDTFICVVGQKQLAYEARAGERTVRRQIEELVSARILIRKERYPEKSGGRLNDALRIVGFKKCYLANNKNARRRQKNDDGATGQNGRKPLPAKMAGSPQGQPANMAGRATGQQVAGVSGQQVAGSYKDTRTNPVNKNAHECTSEDFNFDLEGKGVRDRLRAKHGDDVFRSWFADVIFRAFDATTAVVETDSKFKRDWLRTHHERAILDACRSEFGSDIARINFVWLSRKGIAA